MSSKVDAQKLRRCRSKYIFCWQLNTHQNYVPKLPRKRALGNWKYMLWLPTFVPKVPLARGDTRWSIIHLHSPFMNIWIGNIDQVLLSEPLFIIQNKNGPLIWINVLVCNRYVAVRHVLKRLILLIAVFSIFFTELINYSGCLEANNTSASHLNLP